MVPGTAEATGGVTEDKASTLVGEEKQQTYKQENKCIPDAS